MNEVLLQKIKLLSDSEWKQLQERLEQSPLLQKLAVELRQHTATTVKTRVLVQAVYGNEKPTAFAVLENRFYKLRKKLYDILPASANSIAGRKLAHEEETKELCRSMIEKGEIAQASKLLASLDAQCWANNIFELLPAIADMLIQANHILNKFSDTPAIYAKFEEASELYIALARMKLLTKQVYETNVQQGIGATQPLFKQMDLLARTHAAYPRFKLIYNFVAAYYKAGAGGRNNHIKSYAVSRHIATAKQLMLQYPNMPAIGYAADFQQTQQFKLKELEAMFYFRQFRYAEAAAISNELLADVFDTSKQWRKYLNEVLLSNTIHINIAAKNSTKAFEAVQLYFRFLRDSHYGERMPRAFCELANVAATLHVKPAYFNSKAVLQNLDEFMAHCKKGAYKDLEIATRFLKAKTLLLLGKKDAAIKLFEQVEVKNHLSNKTIRKLFYEMLHAIVVGRLGNRKEFLSRLKKVQFNLQSPENVMEFVWIECAVEKYFPL